MTTEGFSAGITGEVIRAAWRTMSRALQVLDTAERLHRHKYPGALTYGRHSRGAVAPPAGWPLTGKEYFGRHRSYLREGFLTPTCNTDLPGNI